MESTIQTIISIIVATFLLFIFPVYMAYEKKDDISYALAMRYTQDLVDEVRNKGYITKEMYDDYRVKLKTTGNTYEINLTHEYNRYDPITNYYTLVDGKHKLVETSTQQERQQNDNLIYVTGLASGDLNESATKSEVKDYISSVYKDEHGIDKVEDTYKLTTEVFDTNYILNSLNSKKKLKSDIPVIDGSEIQNTLTNICQDHKDTCQYAYLLNVNDNFNITIKNTNTTLATVIYNMITANRLDENTRIYVNYGGTILANKWLDSIDFAKLKYDNVRLDMLNVIYNSEDVEYINTYADMGVSPSGKYLVEFDVKPTAVIELSAEGIEHKNDRNYLNSNNFALGASSGLEKTLSVSIGLNGISLIKGNTASAMSILSYPVTIDDWVNVRVDMVYDETIQQFVAELYINDEKVARSIGLGTSENDIPKINYIGASPVTEQITEQRCYDLEQKVCPEKPANSCSDTDVYYDEKYEILYDAKTGMFYRGIYDSYYDSIGNEYINEWNDVSSLVNQGRLNYSDVGDVWDDHYYQRTYDLYRKIWWSNYNEVNSQPFNIGQFVEQEGNVWRDPTCGRTFNFSTAEWSQESEYECHTEIITRCETIESVEVNNIFSGYIKNIRVYN